MTPRGRPAPCSSRLKLLLAKQVSFSAWLPPAGGRTLPPGCSTRSAGGGRLAARESGARWTRRRGQAEKGPHLGILSTSSSSICSLKVCKSFVICNPSSELYCGLEIELSSTVLQEGASGQTGCTLCIGRSRCCALRPYALVQQCRTLLAALRSSRSQATCLLTADAAAHQRLSQAS